MGTGVKKPGGKRKLRRLTREERRAVVCRNAEKGPKALEPTKRGRGRPRGTSRLAEPVKQEVAAVKRRFPTFGFLKIKNFLRRFSGMKVSTGSVAKVLRQEGLPPVAVVRRRRRKKSVGPPQEFERAHPNDLWQSDITYVDVPWSRKPLHLVAFMDDRTRS